MQLQRQRAHLIGLSSIAVGKVTHVEPNGQRLVSGQAHMLIDQEDGFLPMAERELFLYRVERDRLPAVGAALTPSDYLPFWRFDQSARNLDGKSLRLNIFEGVGPVDCSTRWQVKGHMKWIPNCPLPEGEVLMRYQPT